MASSAHSSPLNTDAVQALDQSFNLFGLNFALLNLSIPFVFFSSRAIHCRIPTQKLLRELLTCARLFPCFHLSAAGAELTIIRKNMITTTASNKIGILGLSDLNGKYGLSFVLDRKSTRLNSSHT